MDRAHVDSVVQPLHPPADLCVLIPNRSRAFVAHRSIAGLSVPHREIAELALRILLVAELALLLATSTAAIDVYHGSVYGLVPFARHRVYLQGGLRARK